MDKHQLCKFDISFLCSYLYKGFRKKQKVDARGRSQVGKGCTHAFGFSICGTFSCEEFCLANPVIPVSFKINKKQDYIFFCKLHDHHDLCKCSGISWSHITKIISHMTLNEKADDGYDVNFFTIFCSICN